MWIRKYWDFDLAYSAGALFLLLIFVNVAKLRPVLADLRPTLVVGIAAIVLLLLRGLRGGAKISLGPAGWCWFGLTLVAYLSASMAAKGQDKAFEGAEGVLKCFATYFIVYNIITSLKALRALYWVLLASLTLMVYFAIKVMILTGGRLSLYVGPFYGINETAMGMAMFVPFCLMLAALPRQEFKWNRVFLVLAICCVVLIIRTFSRGGFIALMLVLFMWLMHEKRKVLALVVTAGLVGLLVVLSGIVAMSKEQGGESYRDRLQLLMKIQSATERDGSVQGRLDMAKEALQIWSQYPIIGIGVMCYGEYTQWEVYHSFRAAGRQVYAAVHNSLLHVLLETGLIGFAMYVSLLLITYRNISKVRKRPGKDAFFTAVSEAMFISFVAYFVAANTLSEQFNWCFVIFTGIAAGTERVYRAIDYERASSLRHAEALPTASLVPMPAQHGG